MRTGGPGVKLLLQKLRDGMMMAVIALAWPFAVQADPLSVGEVREKLERQVAALLQAKVDVSTNHEKLLELSSLYLDLGYGVYAEPSRKLAAFQEGARLAKKAIEIQEGAAKAHFLYAANLGSASELEGGLSSVLIIQALKRHAHRAWELDKTSAPVHHMLGRLYEELPWFLGGDQEAAGEHFQKAAELDIRYAPAHLDLAKWLIKKEMVVEAKRELQSVLEWPPIERRWIWEKRHRPEALFLLGRLGQ
jgi:tetratricopeptide (TPR) repeat protein